MEHPEANNNPEFYQERYDLGYREREILGALNQGKESVVSFQGLKRKLGMHQETLSRALTRLHRDGLVERTPEGYRINRKAGTMQLQGGNAEQSFPIIHAYLLPSTDLRSLILGLRGSWFRKLRWLGYSQTESDVTLTWITEDGEVQIDLRVSGSSASIEARVKEVSRMAEAVLAAHELFGHMSSLHKKPPAQDGMMFLRMGPEHSSAS